jgi:hypothetical protein
MEVLIFWDVTPHILVESTDILEEHVTYCLLYACFSLGLQPMKMKATCSSEKSVDFHWTTWHLIPEDRALPNYHQD